MLALRRVTWAVPDYILALVLKNQNAARRWHNRSVIYREQGEMRECVICQQRSEYYYRQARYWAGIEDLEVNF